MTKRDHPLFYKLLCLDLYRAFHNFVLLVEKQAVSPVVCFFCKY